MYVNIIHFIYIYIFHSNEDDNEDGTVAGTNSGTKSNAVTSGKDKYQVSITSHKSNPQIPTNLNT